MISGEGPAPDLVLSLVARLPVGSMYVSMRLAEEHGGEPEDYFDKTLLWFTTVDLYEAQMLNTKATGQWKNGRPPKFARYPLPGDLGKSDEEKAKDALSPLERLHLLWGGAGQH